MGSGKKNLRLIVAGGRRFGQQPGEVELLNATLDRIHRERGIACIIHGGCAGCDNWAQRWCESRKVPVQPVLANWYQEGRGAGPKRNQKMIDESNADGVVAFRGGDGTADCVRRAELAGLTVWRVGWK